MGIYLVFYWSMAYAKLFSSTVVFCFECMLCMYVCRQKEGETVAEADVAAATEGDAETGREAEDDKEMTYAEYKAQLAKQRTAAAQPQFNVRKANEGHEDATWKKMVPLKKEHLAGEEETGGDEQQVKMLQASINIATLTPSVFRLHKPISHVCVCV